MSLLWFLATDEAKDHLQFLSGVHPDQSLSQKQVVSDHQHLPDARCVACHALASTKQTVCGAHHYKPLCAAARSSLRPGFDCDVYLLCFCCRPLTNTGQGRRRLNARAALRAAGQDRQPQAAPLASPPQVANPILAVRNPSLDTESSGSRKSKAMAGAYSSTYSKLQAQGQLLHPSMQLAMAEAGVSTNQELMMSGTASANFRVWVNGSCARA